MSLQLAFTMDDLPLWPQSAPPAGFDAAGIVSSIRRALSANGISGVYRFFNSWPLDSDPAFAGILDDWLADGHHLANHTHGHIQLPEVDAATFIADIDRATDRLAPWLREAPLSLFRHPLCHWGESDAKRIAVNDPPARSALVPADVTSSVYAWV